MIPCQELLILRKFTHAKIVTFFEELQKGRFLGTMCVHCGALYCPPRSDCKECLSSDMKWVELSKEGELLTFTVVHNAPKTFSFQVPYVVGIVKLKEGPKIMAILDVKPNCARIGMKLHMTLKEHVFGQKIYCFKGVDST